MKIDKFKIEEWMNLYENKAKIDLCATTIKSLSLKYLLKLANTDDLLEIMNVPLNYGNILGSKRLLKSICGLYENKKNNNIAITHGAIGANQLVFLSLLEQGDEVILAVPNYQQHSSIPKSLGIKVKEIFLKEENSWIIDVDEIKKNITNKTKLITFSNPNNPTGALIPEQTMIELVKLAEKYGIWILSDEVYRGLNLFENPYSKAICDLYDKGISVGSMSKTYSIAGVRVGWICAKEEIIKKINRHRQYNTISISIIDDYLSSLALENREKIEKRNLNILKNNYEILKKHIENSEYLSCVLPQGGTTAFIKYNKDIPSETLCKDFQEKTKIALLPGKTMGIENFVRIGFGGNNQELDFALCELEKYLEKLKKINHIYV